MLLCISWSNKLTKAKQNRQRADVSDVDSDIIVPNNNLVPKKQLPDIMSGKPNACVAQTLDNNDIIKLLEAMRSDITRLKTEVAI